MVFGSWTGTGFGSGVGGFDGGPSTRASRRSLGTSAVSAGFSATIRGGGGFGFAATVGAGGGDLGVLFGQKRTATAASAIDAAAAGRTNLRRAAKTGRRSRKRSRSSAISFAVEYRR